MSALRESFLVAKHIVEAKKPGAISEVLVKEIAFGCESMYSIHREIPASQNNFT